MSSINRIVVTGRLVRDPELRTTTTGKQVASFSIAVDRRFKTDDVTADFFNCTAWGQSAEFITNYGGKGRLIAVDGRLQSRKYENKDGVTVNAVEIVAENVTILDRPKDGEAPKASTDDDDPWGE